MNQLPYMPLYWNDLLSDNKVRVMSNEEFGSYMRLLGAAWHEDVPGTLPADDDVLARLAGAELSLWRKLSRRILPCFALNEQAGRYEQKRMMAEHAKAAAQMEMRHSRATAGAAKKWENQRKQSPPHALALLKHDSSNASQSQSQEGAKAPEKKENRAQGSKDELVAYALERSLAASDGEWLHDKMLTSGWKVDGRPVKDWQALIRNWQRGGYFPSQKPVLGVFPRGRQVAPAEKPISERTYEDTTL